MAEIPTLNDCFLHGPYQGDRCPHPDHRRVRTPCYCGGGDLHEHRPHGGGGRILACLPEPVPPIEDEDSRIGER